MNAESCPAAGFVLAGGRSLRMGSDKALAEFAGRPLIENALAILRDAGLEPQIAGSRSNLTHFAPVIEDRGQGKGPLSGVCAALESTDARHAVFLPVDQPLIPASLIAHLVRHAQITGSTITVASLCGASQTFPAVIHRCALPTFQTELAAGRNACWSAFGAAAGPNGACAVAVELFVQAGQLTHPRQLQPGYWFLNANTPEELARVNTLARTRPITDRMP